ncbi:MAG TPA: hypothetical protein VHD36_15805 [Pirellulales bacterium]|nr:hypothetical protein [Pirellulales bacterium]
MALAVALTATAPCRAELKTDAAKTATASKSTGANLKWRSPKKVVTTENAAADARALGAFTDEPTAVSADKGTPRKELRFTQPSDGPSSLHVKSDDGDAGKNASKATESADASSKPAELATKPAAKPIHAAKSRTPVTVKRLGDAEASPHSLTTTGASGSSLTIKLASHEEPQIDPFGDDEAPALEMAQKPARPSAVQAMMQDRRSSAAQNPFGDEQPKLERVPTLAPPAEVPTEPGQPQELAQALPYNCPTPREYVKRLSDISTNIAAEPGEFPVECGLGDEQFVPRNFHGTLFAWKASALCHKPLYFEDIELERYGQTCSPLFQPIISAAKFYLALPILPYLMGLEPPLECVYPLGYYRPGSCAPFIIPPVPISLRGALLEAGVWVAGVALVP